jgi:cephalosporin hydroxylase
MTIVHYNIEKIAGMTHANDELISGRELKVAAGQYLAHIAAKADGRHGQALGIFDKWFLRATKRLFSCDPDQSWEDSIKQEMLASPAQAPGLEWDFTRLRMFLDRWRQGRFVTHKDRERSHIHYAPKYGTEFGSDVLLTCQGASHALQWRGLPLMKTVFDFAIYPQLMAELCPRSIFEIGSGSGASALWLGDQAAIVSPGCLVHSVDLVPATAVHPAVTFYQGDCSRPESLFDVALLNGAPHPWLVIEDAHHNVAAVLNYFHGFLRSGDYLYIEDSEIKREDIRQFLTGREDCYVVDTKYTDFFGRNATCALDSIFVRAKD